MQKEMGMERHSPYSVGSVRVGFVLVAILAWAVEGPAAIGADRNVLCEEFTANT